LETKTGDEEPVRACVWYGEGLLTPKAPGWIRSAALSTYSLINPVREAPAVAGVTVAMPCVDEAVLQGLADVLG
jgi:hypothetical protein